MTTGVFLIVLFAALLHATWNAAIKASEDKSEAMLGLVLGHTPFALAALLILGVPNFTRWPFILAGALLHIGYQILLMRSYRQGDLTQVYPIARGSAPLITAILSTALTGERLSPLGWAAVAMIAVGLMSLVLVQRDDGTLDRRSAFLALATGVFTAGYSLTDGEGARLAGTAVSFYAFLSILNAFLMCVIAHASRPGMIARVLEQSPGRSLLSGGASFTAFSMVVWAFTKSAIPLVAALRETSVIFALLIGVIFLNERLNLVRLAATMATTSGALLAKLAK